MKEYMLHSERIDYDRRIRNRWLAAAGAVLFAAGVLFGYYLWGV